MLFNSPEFLVFFVIVSLVYFGLPLRARWYFLLAASCYFYMALIPVYILILLLTIVVDYCAGLFIERAEGGRRRWFLALSIMANVGVLAVFKYFKLRAVQRNRPALLGPRLVARAAVSRAVLHRRRVLQCGGRGRDGVGRPAIPGPRGLRRTAARAAARPRSVALQSALGQSCRHRRPRVHVGRQRAQYRAAPLVRGLSGPAGGQDRRGRPAPRDGRDDRSQCGDERQWVPQRRELFLRRGDSPPGALRSGGLRLRPDV